ncbi:MAG TPA: M28 family peptidase, partial [Kofleriaceae bacterium]|nr:M28 family peptidase [Kofleriaceae bacterium]
KGHAEPLDPDDVIAHYAELAAEGSRAFLLHRDGALDITEYEQAQELRAGLDRIGGHVVDELRKLIGGDAHALSRTLLDGNPAWPPALSEATAAGRFDGVPFSIALALALSRTQDDQGNARWTLFGASHAGPGAAFWKSFGDGDGERFARTVGWLLGRPPSLDGVRVLADPDQLPAFARPLLLQRLDGVTAVVTFQPFAALPPPVQEAYLACRLRLVPSPGGMIFFEHPGYRQLAQTLPRATQIPLLHLFPRVEGGYTLRIPQSGWLDEGGAGHKVAGRVARTHRWERKRRDAGVAEAAWEDEVSTALFSTDPAVLGLYGKPMARNAQLWRPDYRLLLDGPRASVLELERAARFTDRGGRYGYRFLFPPMRAGRRELYWHLPLCARLDDGADEATVLEEEPPLGFIAAEPQPGEEYLPAIELQPRLLDRAGHREAARAFTGADPGRPRFTTCHNLRAVLEAAEGLGPLPPSLARALVHCARDLALDDWIAELAGRADDGDRGVRAAAAVRAAVGEPADAGEPLTFAATASPAFEQRVWNGIAALADGDYRAKENADADRDLEALGDHLHERYRALIETHGMSGRAQVVDHGFRWQTDFDYSWMPGWARNQARQASERNVVCMIPGRDRGQAVIMGDHYDTAYMEDVYEAGKGGRRRAAAGADDNHSATTALLLAADVLLPLARAGKLARDVWLIHLTGEEFPADCMGARALCQALVERRLRFCAEDGTVVDVSRVRAAAAFVLDMIGHNSERDRDVFQIAPGEGTGSARLARTCHLANLAWNQRVPAWNQARAEGAHLALRGEIRPEWSPRSALYNTDGQIFSDVGVPVVLFMENYDINRTGYHDTHDTMDNIDLDYAAALTAIAIEAVARTACAADL